jgi:archaellum biogenesis ATPase FlaH
MKDGSLYRSIKPETAHFYGHLFERDSSGEIIRVYYPETKSTFKGELNSLRGYKTRDLPKAFGRHNIGIVGTSNDLSGSHKFTSGGKWLLIVAGEEDKLAAAQMLRDYQIQRKQEDYDRIAVVGIHCGEGSLAKVCANSYDFLDTFEEIILCMDNDEAGRKAVQEAVKVLPEGKVKVMTTSLKDCSEMLQQGKQKQFISNFYDAKPLVSTGIQTATEASQGIREHLLADKITLPQQLHRLQTAMRGGIKSTGCLINIIGDTSVGKSFFSDVLVHHFIFNSPIVPTILSIERTSAELVLDLYSYHLGQNLTWFEDGHDALDYLDQPEVKALCDDMLMDEYGAPRFNIIDSREGTLDILKAQIEKAMRKHNSRLFVLDVLSDVLRSLPISEQEDFLMFMKQKKKEGAIIISVLHTRKRGVDQGNTGKDEEGSSFKRVNEYDAIGTSSLPQSADINIVLNRNKMAKDPIERNTTYVDMPKCRGGMTGSDICELYYNPETRKQYDKFEWMEQQRSNF